MSLTVDTRGVKNHLAVCYKEKTEEGYPYSDTTYYLAFASMAVGIGKITEKNYGEVYFRHMFLHSMNKTTCPVTLQDVKNNIGLKTNVAFETRGRWKNRIVDGHMKTLAYYIRKEMNAL